MCNFCGCEGPGENNIKPNTVIKRLIHSTTWKCKNYHKNRQLQNWEAPNWKTRQRVNFLHMWRTTNELKMYKDLISQRKKYNWLFTPEKMLDLTMREIHALKPEETIFKLWGSQGPKTFVHTRCCVLARRRGNQIHGHKFPGWQFGPLPWSFKLILWFHNSAFMKFPSHISACVQMTSLYVYSLKHS